MSPDCIKPGGRPGAVNAFANSREHGAALIVSLLMLTAVLMLGISAAQIALQGEKAARNDRDRQVALQAAEAALVDAQLDIENSSRSALFERGSPEAFSMDCSGGSSALYLGLCRAGGQVKEPAWQTADFFNVGVPYGHYTGQAFQAGQGVMPAQRPRYLIELVSCHADGSDGSASSSCSYRITAVGFGVRTSTQVALQVLYRTKGRSKDGAMVQPSRYGWREISNWQELHDT